MAVWSKKLLNGSKKCNDSPIHSFETSWLHSWRSEVLECRTGNPVSPDSAEPFISCAKALPTKRSEKDYGDENVVGTENSVDHSEVAQGTGVSF